MKNSVISITLAAALVILLAPTWVVGDQTETGNGCPSGAHYNLNLIGMAKAKHVDPDSITSQGHRIFVQLGNKDNTATTNKKPMPNHRRKETLFRNASSS